MVEWHFEYLAEIVNLIVGEFNRITPHGTTKEAAGEAPETWAGGVT